MTIAVGAARHRDFGEVHGQPAGRVVEGDGGRSHACLGAMLGPGEDHVFGLLAAQETIGLFAEHPAQRVGDVRLARAVRPDNGSDAFAELELHAGGEGFVSVQFEAFQA